MTEHKAKLDKTISALVSSSASHRQIARRLFLYDFSSIFVEDWSRGFVILDAICNQFNLPFSCVKIVGSTQTGFSYYKNRDFIPGRSDLDVAIVNSTLFQYYSQEVYWLTKRYTDLTKFSAHGGASDVRSFREYLSIGYFRPDLMPKSSLKEQWFGFFSKLGTRHSELFKNINAGIYLSEAFFEMKQAGIVDEYKKANP